MLQKAGEATFWQLKTANIGDDVLDCIEGTITQNSFGAVILTAQDGCLIQIDIVEKTALDSYIPERRFNGTTARNPVLRGKIVQALLGLNFGQVTLTVKNGKVTQIERNEKTKWSKIEGLHGDGI